VHSFVVDMVSYFLACKLLGFGMGLVAGVLFRAEGMATLVVEVGDTSDYFHMAGCCRLVMAQGYQGQAFEPCFGYPLGMGGTSWLFTNVSLFSLLYFMLLTNCRNCFHLRDSVYYVGSLAALFIFVYFSLFTDSHQMFVCTEYSWCRAVLLHLVSEKVLARIFRLRYMNVFTTEKGRR